MKLYYHERLSQPFLAEAPFFSRLEVNRTPSREPSKFANGDKSLAVGDLAKIGKNIKRCSYTL